MDIFVRERVDCSEGRLLSADIQRVINEAKEGDCIVFEKGSYLLSTIYLKSGITLKLDKGCSILGSKNFNDYEKDEKVDYPLYQDASHSFFHCSLFVGEKLSNIKIIGEGVIDMQSVWDEKNVRNMVHRGAKCIALKECENVVLEGFSVFNCTDLAIYFAGCTHVSLSKLYIKTYIDGISPDNCKDVSISDCEIEAGDDGIVFKSSYTLNRLDVCKNIIVKDCKVKSRCNAIKFGTETNGGFFDFTITNIQIYETRLAGIAVESVDGAMIDNLVFDNITMKNVGTPFFIHLGKRMRGPKDRAVGSISNIRFANIFASGKYVGYDIMPWNYDSFKQNDCYQYPWEIGKAEGFFGKNEETSAWQITSNCCGLIGNNLKNICFENIKLELWGGATKIVSSVPEDVQDYPDVYVYGAELPAKGIFFRHIDGLTIKNFIVNTIKPDVRADFIYEDVANLVIES